MISLSLSFPLSLSLSLVSKQNPEFHNLRLNLYLCRPGYLVPWLEAVRGEGGRGHAQVSGGLAAFPSTSLLPDERGSYLREARRRQNQPEKDQVQRSEGFS